MELNEVIQDALQTSLDTIKPVITSCVNAAVQDTGADCAAKELHCGLQWTLTILNRMGAR